MSGPEIITFGCRLNSFEAEIMRAHAGRAGLDDVVVIHTCAVTAEAERQARQAIRRARRERPEARIVVTGCGAQISPDSYAQMAEVDHVVGNRDKLDPAAWARLGGQGEALARVTVGDLAAIRETAHHLVPRQLVDGLEGRSRAFVQIQQGCDHRCTFCIIPQGRGPSFSLALGEVVAQTRRLVERGHAEVVLTGVDITSYGADLPGAPNLGQLVGRLLRAVPELLRLRLSSIDPAAVDADLVAQIAAEPRLMPHLHLSVQAGHDLTLKRMRRRHGRADVIALTRRLKALRPEIAFGADLIAGFPTETEAMLEATLDLIEEAGLTYLHVFPYSARAGTPAARMPQVAKAERKARAARLRAAGEAALADHLRARVGERDQVLVERDGQGRARDFSPFRFADPTLAVPAGRVVEVQAEAAEAGALIGRLAA